MDFLRITWSLWALEEGAERKERERMRPYAPDKIYMRASIGNISMVYNQLITVAGVALARVRLRRFPAMMHGGVSVFRLRVSAFARSLLNLD